MRDLTKLTITESLEKLENGDISSLDLTNAYLEKIKSEDKKYNSYVTVADSATKDAKAADKLREKGENLPLLGIPIALKDNYLTKELRTTASSKVLDEYIPQYDATIVKRLKDAGAVILGKTNMDAWAHGSSTETSDYGPTKNPRDTSRIPGGSSGGSAAALAADLCAASMGSETAGSTRGPAAWCGVVGLKPTYGLVPRYGIIAMGSSLDSPGPFTKSTKDAAHILSVIAGKDENDATSSSPESTDYLKNLDDDVKGLKIGLPEEYFLKDAEDGVNEMVKKSAKHMESLGAELVEVSLPTTKYAIATYTVVQRSEVFSNLSRYDGIRYGNDRSYFGKEAKRRVMLGAYAVILSQDGKFYRLAQRVRTMMENDFAKAFEKVDVLLAPTMPSIAPKLGASGDQAMFGELADILQEPSSLTGLTGISVPSGVIEGMPIATQFIGRHFDEQTILNAAHAYETTTNWRENVWK